jgi:hypothetical protein
MTKRIAKKVREDAARQIEGAFLALGAVRNEQTGDYEDKYWFIDTKAGQLRMSLDVEGTIWTIFARFEDTDAAKKVIPHGPNSRLNPYSGKWNWHYDFEHGEIALAQFGREVRAILE